MPYTKRYVTGMMDTKKYVIMLWQTKRVCASRRHYADDALLDPASKDGATSRSTLSVM